MAKAVYVDNLYIKSSM